MSSKESLNTLIALHLDGQLSADHSDRLANLLKESQAARTKFWQAVHLHHAAVELADRQWGQISFTDDSEASTDPDSIDSIFPAPFSFAEQAEKDNKQVGFKEVISILSYQLKQTAGKHRVVLATAALFAIAGMIGLALLLNTPGKDTTQPIALDDPAKQDTPTITPNPVATITATHNAQWSSAGGASSPPANLSVGTQLHPNDRLTLTQGFAEITTEEGAVVILEAPVTVELLDHNNAIRLHAGKLVGICETELSKGFTVKTDHADIVDLGTEFGVNVANNQLTTTVFAGEVVLKTPGRATQPLVANQTATLIDDGDGLDLAIEDQAAEGFTLQLPRLATAEQIQSSATPIAAWDFFGSNTSTGIHSGDASTPSGLQMAGFVGQWGTMPANQGAVVINGEAAEVGETTGVSNGITLRWAVDGVGATRWGWQTDRANGLISDYYYINRKGDRWGGSAIPWRIEGLTPGARYDLIFFGTGSHQNGAAVAIEGHDAGNGVGAGATLDAENDANFLSVVADADGTISGTFGNPGDKEAQVAGVQIGLLPETAPANNLNNE